MDKSKAYNYRSAMNLALMDITTYIYENCDNPFDKYRDRWYVNASDLLNKKIRYLNRQLGLHTVNKQQKNRID